MRAKRREKRQALCWVTCAELLCLHVKCLCLRSGACGGRLAGAQRERAAGARRVRAAGARSGFVHLSAMIGEAASAWHWESCYLFYIIKTSHYI